MKQMFKNTTDTSTKRRGFAALFAIVLIIALAGSTVYAADGAAQKVSYPDFKYTVKHFNRDQPDLPDSDQLSIEKAAEAGARYIYDLYGENGDGNTIWMSYSPRANVWNGRVTKTGNELKAGTVIFSISIDAAKGKRLFMFDMRGIGTDQPEKSMSGEDASRLKQQTPKDLEKYQQLAMEYARKHFNDAEVASLDYNGMGLMDFGARINLDFGSPDVTYYTQKVIFFVAADTTGRDSEITIDMETGKLCKIEEYISDEEKEAIRAERQSRAEPGRTVIMGN